MVRQQATTGTWGIPSNVRRTIARMVLDLRAALEDDFRRQLAALGVREDGIRPLPVGRDLTPDDQRARVAAIAVIEREVAAGVPHAEALDAYVRESAFTFLNRAVGLRCLEERRLLTLDGRPETTIKRDPDRGASSLYWRVRNELSPTTPPRDVWRETLRRAWVALDAQVHVLFDPESELAALLPLPPVLQRVVDALNAPEIPTEVYAEDELLGWVYQYYNQQEKSEVYARLGKGKKLEQPEDIIAATCLYTERYMVDYLLQNTLGALWVEMHPDSRLPASWPYYVRPNPPDPPSLAGKGGTDGSPPRAGEEAGERSRRLREVTLLDPACGSGHFLVRAFDLLADMYAEEDLEDPAEVPQLILERNLHGIDIDLRAVQIAALALYLKACRRAGPNFRPHRINLVPADAVLPGDAPPAAYLARFAGDKEMESLITSIWRGLRNVREFGSLLHPERAVDEVVKRRREREKGQLWQRGDAEWERWKADLLDGLRDEFEREAEGSDDLGRRLFGRQVAKGISLVEALGRRYDVVVTNPPYAGSKNLSPRLKAFVEKEYRDGKRDLYAAFILRCRDFCRPDGYAGMVTQQSWMFLRSYAALRKDTLERTAITTIAHLGPRAFEEISGEVVNIALFTLRAAPPAPGHLLTAYRLVGPKSPAEKDALQRRAIAGRAAAVVSVPAESDFLPIPETPFVYWLRPRFFELLRSDRRLGDVADVRQGVATTDNERFLRHWWEVAGFGTVERGKAIKGRWFRYAKGGRYQKWAGVEWLVIDWADDGRAMKQHVVTLPGNTHYSRVIRSESHYFRPAITYTQMSRGSMGTRLIFDSIFDVKGMCIFTDVNGTSLTGLSSITSTHIASYLLRVVTQNLEFHAGYVANFPMPSADVQLFNANGESCIALKQELVSTDLSERVFESISLERATGSSTASYATSVQTVGESIQTLLHSLEGVNERLVCDAYGLDEGDVQAVIDETSTPAGWHPLIAAYDIVPDPPPGIEVPAELLAPLKDHPRLTFSEPELAWLKTRLRTLYEAGPGASAVETEAEDLDAGGEDEEGDAAALGARIPIPAETFLEELSQKLEVHPITVYRLLEEMRRNEGLVSPPLMKQQLEDYVSVTVLRQLGYRWPEQDAYEKEHGPILAPDLVDEDGIIPLVPCADQPTAEQRVRTRLERDFGEEGAEQSLREFRQYVGRDLDDWLRREFFKRHVQQFKQRPIAWHFVSPERTFEAFVLYHRLSRATLQKLRAQYAGALIARLQAEQARAKERKDEAAVSRLQLQIEDVEEFRARLEKIERGDELKYRIRCRWRGETETGRPGPYVPDIDDGVKVNIRPFQEAGLLADREVIKKW